MSTAAQRYLAKRNGVAPVPTVARRPAAGQPSASDKYLSQAPAGPVEAPRSLIDQTLDAGKGIFTGIGALAVSAAKTPKRFLYDMPTDFARGELVGQGDFGSRFSQNVKEYAPLLYDLGSTYDDTVKDVGTTIAAAAPGGMAFGDNPYSVASREGRIVDSLLRDVGNVALVGGAAKGALTGVSKGAYNKGLAAQKAGRIPEATARFDKAAQYQRYADKAGLVERPVRAAAGRGVRAGVRQFKPNLLDEGTNSARFLNGDMRAGVDALIDRAPEASGTRRLLSRYGTQQRGMTDTITDTNADFMPIKIDAKDPIARASSIAGKENAPAVLTSVGGANVATISELRAANAPDVWAEIRPRAAKEYGITDADIDKIADLGDLRYGRAESLAPEARANAELIERALGELNEGDRGSRRMTEAYIAKKGEDKVTAAPMNDRLQALEGKLRTKKGYQRAQRSATEATRDAQRRLQAEITRVDRRLRSLRREAERVAKDLMEARPPSTRGALATKPRATKATRDKINARYARRIAAEEATLQRLTARLQEGDFGDASARRAQRRVEAVERKITELLDEAATTGEAVPAIFRNDVTFGKRLMADLREAGIEGDFTPIIDSLAKLRERGGALGLITEGKANLDRVQFRTTGRLRPSQERSLSTGRLDYQGQNDRNGIPRDGKKAAENLRQSVLDYDKSFEAQLFREWNELRIDQARVLWDRMTEQGLAQRLDEFGEVDWTNFDEIRPFLDENKMVVVNPRNPFTSIETPDQWPTDPTVLGRLRLMDADLFANNRSMFRDSAWDRMARLMVDKPTQAFKNLTLALSPQWQVGNIVGNTMMATIAGGIGPVDLARHVIQNVADYRASGLGRKGVKQGLVDRGIDPSTAAEVARTQRDFQGIPARLQDSANATALRDDIADAQLFDEKVAGNAARRALGGLGKKRPYKRVVDSSYRLNAFMDSLGRSAVFTAKLEKKIQRAERLGNPFDTNVLIEQALRETLQAMGDFGNMTAFERKVVRRFVPFYAWMRHATVNLAFKLPIDHPLRTAWVLNIGAQFGNRDGLIELTDGIALDTRYLNPWDQIGGVISPNSLARGANPFLKLAVGEFTGVNLNRGFGGEFTRPLGTGEIDSETGMPKSTPPSLLSQVGDSIAPRQIRFAQDLIGYNDIVRYDSNDPMLQNGELLEATTPDMPRIPRVVAGYFGARFVNPESTAQRRTRATDRAAKAKVQADSYRRRLEAAEQ